MTVVYPIGYTIATMIGSHILRPVTLRNTPRTFALSGVAALFAMVLLIAVLPDEGRVVRDDHAVLTHTLVRADRVPLPFEGVLVPKDDAVLASQAQGRLSDLPAREGAVVHAGEVLAVVGQPVLAAQRSTLVTKIRLMEEQRGLVEAERDTALTLATKAAQTDATVGTAQVTLTDAQVSTAAKALRATLAQQYLSATEALDFLADTTALSTSEVSKLRVEAARMLAGSERASYLGQRIMTGGSDRGLYDDLQALETDEPRVLLELSQRLLEGLSTLARAYESAEREAYERASALNEGERVQYNTYRSAVRTAQASVESAQGALRTALEAHELAVATAGGTLAARDAELEQAKVVQAGEVRVSGATLANLYAELRALDASLGEAVVKAPYAGTIVETFVDPGTYVAPGTPLVRIQSATGLEVRVTIPERYLPQMMVGTPATFRDGAAGVLDRISPHVDERAGGVTAYIVLNAVEAPYTTGSHIRGELELVVDEHGDGVYGIPHRYLSFDWGGPVVRTDMNMALPVTIVRDMGQVVYVTGRDLADGLVLVP